MSHTYTKLLTHIMFSTKNRDRTIAAEVQPKLHAYLGGIVRDLGGSALAAGGVEDHVHLLVILPPRLALSDTMREIKSGSSRWMKEEHEPKFAWQTGFTAFSVSQTKVAETIKYIETQAEHHRIKSFKEELLEFLKGYEVEYDEKYLWD
ncbi:MAG: IS200/IS605 family transposase [Planctomycetes bacterium]|nr:IS200/IS605 family transposase [Planctomycetota bacterium]